MIYGFVAPGLLAFLAFNQAWFADARPWLDPKYNQDALLRGDLTGDQLVPPGRHQRGVARRAHGRRGRQRAAVGGEVMDADHLEEIAGVPGSTPFAPEPTTGRAVTQYSLRRS